MAQLAQFTARLWYLLDQDNATTVPRLRWTTRESSRCAIFRPLPTRAWFVASINQDERVIEIRKISLDGAGAFTLSSPAGQRPAVRPHATHFTSYGFSQFDVSRSLSLDPSVEPRPSMYVSYPGSDTRIRVHRYDVWREEAVIVESTGFRLFPQQGSQITADPPNAPHFSTSIGSGLLVAYNDWALPHPSLTRERHVIGLDFWDQAADAWSPVLTAGSIKFGTDAENTLTGVQRGNFDLAHFSFIARESDGQRIFEGSWSPTTGLSIARTIYPASGKTPNTDRLRAGTGLEGYTVHPTLQGAYLKTPVLHDTTGVMSIPAARSIASPVWSRESVDEWTPQVLGGLDGRPAWWSSACVIGDQDEAPPAGDANVHKVQGFEPQESTQMLYAIGPEADGPAVQLWRAPRRAGPGEGWGPWVFIADLSGVTGGVNQMVAHGGDDHALIVIETEIVTEPKLPSGEHRKRVYVLFDPVDFAPTGGGLGTVSKPDNGPWQPTGAL